MKTTITTLTLVLCAMIVVLFAGCGEGSHGHVLSEEKLAELTQRNQNSAIIIASRTSGQKDDHIGGVYVSACIPEGIKYAYALRDSDNRYSLLSDDYFPVYSSTGSYPSVIKVNLAPITESVKACPDPDKRITVYAHNSHGSCFTYGIAFADDEGVRFITRFAVGFSSQSETYTYLYLRTQMFNIYYTVQSVY